MKTIWKWTLTNMTTVISMPIGGEVLDVQCQHGKIQLWALVDPSHQSENRRFTIYGTGYDIPSNPGNYVGTAQLEGGDLVVHIFEDPK